MKTNNRGFPDLDKYLEGRKRKLVNYREGAELYEIPYYSFVRLSILGKDSKAKDDKPLEVVTTYVKENTAELVDPIDVQKKVEEIQERRAKLLSELDTQIKAAILRVQCFKTQ